MADVGQTADAAATLICPRSRRQVLRISLEGPSGGPIVEGLVDAGLSQAEASPITTSGALVTAGRKSPAVKDLKAGRARGVARRRPITMAIIGGLSSLAAGRRHATIVVV